jgi:hypothetical protein
LDHHRSWLRFTKREKRAIGTALALDAALRVDLHGLPVGDQLAVAQHLLR